MNEALKTFREIRLGIVCTDLCQLTAFWWIILKFYCMIIFLKNRISVVLWKICLKNMDDRENLPQILEKQG